MIKKFENFNNVQIGEILKEYPRDAYIIILHDRYSYIEKKYGETITFAKIINIYTETSVDDFKDEPTTAYFVKIQVIDWASEISHNFEKSITNFKVDNDRIKLLYKSISQKDCQQKFEEIKNGYNVKWDMNKFNV